eukprot:PITA_28505
MANQEGGLINTAPMFNGKNYVFWKLRMNTYIQSLGAHVWDVVEEEYKRPPALITKDHKLEFTCNAKMHALLTGLPESEFFKVMDCKSAKENSDKMRSCYEGDNKVSAIEEMENLNTLTLDQLLGILNAYEMRSSKGNYVAKESTFKVEKKCKDEHVDTCFESYEEEAKFVRRLKRGSGKYKG